ncbi:50S ribosomal protein L35 [Candidatus Microgenomates bacterium]|nr:50S ribosomal protein L35 [Candidatus Microgenomates bacterium]
MPKAKTRQSVIKRFKVTKTGKIMRGHSFARHLSVKKSAKRKRNLRKPVQVKASFAKRLRKILGVRKSK